MNRERFVEQFATGWRSGSLDAFVDYFVSLMDPDVRLTQPPLPAQRGRDGFVRFSRFVFGLMPDLRAEVTGWTATEQGVDIELDLVGTLAGRPMRLHSRDEIALRDGRILSRRAHLDRKALLLATLRRPSVLPRLGRAVASSVR